MARYIDANKFLEDEIKRNGCVPLVGVSKYINGEESFDGEHLDILIDNAPTADVVEVVRCEKCKHGDVSTISKSKDGQEEIACYCTLKNRATDLDSYCPSGKRK